MEFRLAAIIFLVILLSFLILCYENAPQRELESFDQNGIQEHIGYSSGGYQRIAETRLTGNHYDDYLTELGKKEGKFYARYFRGDD